MSVQFLGYDVNADSNRTPARDLAAFIQINLGLGALHVSFLARVNVAIYCKSHFILEPTPATCCRHIANGTSCV